MQNKSVLACYFLNSHLLFAFCFLAGPVLETTAQDHRRFLKWSYQDAGSLLSAIGPKIPLLAIVGGATLASGTRIDEPFQSEVRNSFSHRNAWGTYLNATNELGGPKINLPVTGIFVATLFTHNTKLQDAAFTSLQSLLYAGILSYGLKQAIGRYRPEEGFRADKFNPFSAHSSFPSGHTTAAFAIITPWVLYYPHPITYGLFALSTGTAISRMARDKHWPTDVIAGAAIGFFTGRYLARRHNQKPLENRINFSSSASSQGFSLTAKW